MNAHSKTAFTFSRRPADRPVAADVREGLLKDPGFGKVFTDHMVTIRWTKDRGWHDAAESGNITAELLRRGYDRQEIAALWGGNFLRVLRIAEERAG